MSKIQVVIMTCDKPAYNNRLKALRQTCLRDVPENFSVSVFNSTEYGIDSYDESPFRFKAVCTAFREGNYDYLLKLDDDVIPSWKTLRLPPDGSHYHGHKVPRVSKTKGLYYVAGPVIWLDSEAVSILAEELPETVGIDDMIAGEILSDYGIYPTFSEYHYIVRRTNLPEITELDAIKLQDRGFALELGHPNNYYKLWDYYKHLDTHPVQKAVFNGDTMTPRMSTRKGTQGGSVASPAPKNTPVVAHSSSVPMRNFNPRLKRKV